jgi:diguanylate cyclase (GGDEF)-like protein
VSTTAPVVLVGEYLWGTPADGLPAALTCLFLFPLILARVTSLLVVHRRLAVTDAVTGVRTRRYFEEQLGRHVATARRAGSRLGLLLLEIDHLGSVNDRYGHDGGDRVLQEVARRLDAAVRPGDVVARHGGGEFAVLLPGLSPDDVERLARRVRDLVAEAPVAVGTGSGVRVTLSVGAVVLPDHAATAADLAAAAHRALSAAKDGGRNRVAVAPRLAWVPA